MRDKVDSMTATVVLPQHIAEEIDGVARLPIETAGVLLASLVFTDANDARLLARRMHWVTESEYIRRGEDHLTIASQGYVPFLAEAEAIGAVAIWVHTHPGTESRPSPSDHDWEVDRQIADVFRLRTNSPYYGTLIFSPRPEGLEFSGYIQSDGGLQVPIQRLWQVGDRFRLTSSFLLPGHEVHADFDRNVRALGGVVQQTLGDLRVAIVGCGGTGSAVAEQLVRLGVRNFVLFDPDQLSGSNVTRVYGSTASDIGKSKIETLAAYLRRIAPDTVCSLVKSMITMLPAARKLCSCDVIFGCTDDNAGRLVLSRFSTYMLTPVFDSGVLVTSDANGELRGIDGRITTLVPGQACLVCRGRIDLSRAATELLTPEERRRREDEGYAPALGRTEPAVVAFTTMVAAAAVNELLERLIGFGPEPRPSEVLLRCHDREISTNVAAPHLRHYCDFASGKLGIGITEPFLEQTWPA